MKQAADENICRQNLRAKFELASAAADFKPPVKAKCQGLNLQAKFEPAGAAADLKSPVKAKCRGLKRSASEGWSLGVDLQSEEPAPKRSRITTWLSMAWNAGCSIVRMASSLRAVGKSHTEGAFTALDSAPSSLEVPNAAAAQSMRGPSGEALRDAGVALSAGPAMPNSLATHGSQPRQCRPRIQACQTSASKMVTAAAAGESKSALVPYSHGISFESLLHVQPENKVVFPRASTGATSSSTLSIRNVSPGFVAFKIKTTSMQCLAHPNHGLIAPSEQQEICLTLKQDGSSNHRYQVQAAAVEHEEPDWKTLSKSAILERQLGVSVAEKASERGGIFIKADPVGELCFAPKKSQDDGVVSTLKLVNISGKHVAFKMKATHSNCFEVSPPCGTMTPNQQVQIQCRLTREEKWDRHPSFLVQAVAFETGQHINKLWSELERESLQEFRWKAVLERYA